MTAASRERFKPRVQAVDIAGRTPPNNPELEAAVLSAELTSERAVDEVLAVLPTAEPFYSDANRRIHAAVIELRAAGTPVDFGTVANVLVRQERLQAIGGMAYLTKIVDATPAVANVAAHAHEVRQLWRVRRAIEASQQIAATGYTDYGDTDAFLSGAVETLSNVADDKLEQQEATQVYDVMRDTIASYENGGVLGVATGLHDLDDRTGGMRDGELIIVAGRPGTGKTSLALTIGAIVASRKAPEKADDPPQLGVMVFSLEMPKLQLGQRMVCTESRVSLQAFRKQTLPPDVWDRVVDNASRLSQLPLWIDDTPAITLQELRAKIRKQQHAFDKRWPGTDSWKRRIGLVVVDYLQLMTHPGAESREQEVSAISRGLKAMAKALGVPVVALAQLNRAVEARSAKDKRPQLADLRDSGAIEQDADMVWFVYRPEMYFTPEEASSDRGRRFKGYAEILVAKQRNGPTGRVPVTFIEEYTRFENRAREAFRDEED